MDDFRALQGNNLWVWILLAFLLFTGFGRCGDRGIMNNLECSFGNLFDCNNGLMWIILAILAYYFLNNNCDNGIFRSEIQ